MTHTTDPPKKCCLECQHYNPNDYPYMELKRSALYVHCAQGVCQEKEVLIDDARRTYCTAWTARRMVL